MAIVRVAAALFLVFHGISHPLVWGMYRADTWSPRRSWLIGDATVPALGLAAVTAACFVLAALALVLELSWWPQAAIAGAVASLLLIALTFTLRWWAGLAIDALVIALAVRALTS